MALKVNIGDPKTGQTHKLELEDAKALSGKRIGETFKGELIDKTGYEFTVTGGSDNAGFPMRKDVDGSQRRKVLLSGGVGFHSKRSGLRKRKTVSGNTIGPKTAQVNLVVAKAGKEPLTAPEQAPAEEAPAEQ